MKSRFKNREEVGKLLSEELKEILGDSEAIVLSLPRGGIPIGAIIAKSLGLEFNIYISKKIPHPENEEFAIGAVGEFGEVTIDPYFSHLISEEPISSIKDKIELYKTKYRKKSLPSLKNKTVIIADDGIATGLSVLASIKDIQKQHPSQIIIAIGVIPKDTYNKLHKLAKIVALLISDDPFFSVGAYFEDFHQLSDSEVMEYLSNEQ